MSKRKVEQQPLGTLLPPCKRRVWEPSQWSRHCTPEDVHIAPRQKRKLEPRSAPSVETISSPECERLTQEDRPAASSHPPCKKPRVSQSNDATAVEFRCQKDEAFCEFNSFHYWRTPLPDVDFSDIAVDRKSMLTVTDLLEEMDS
ncbi:uncharacterized protein C9orf40 homolog [Mixophyes fleayi]|uniref:uncharacterized protein C9orf40 homolog n=1 Tax=Mixophyes fleayi TaxID=3061075 RepID=UPI003F4D71D1